MLDQLKQDLENMKKQEADQLAQLNGTRGVIQYIEHYISQLEDYEFQPSITENELAELVAGPGARVVSINECQ